MPWYTLPAQFGAGLLSAQVALWFIFAKLLPDGPWRAEPGFTAHQAIALPFVAYLAVVGLTTWLSDSSPGFDTALSRAVDVHPIGAHLVQLAAGAVAIWDTPTCLAVASLRAQKEMLVHHVLMAVVACLSASLPFMTYYCIFFFGVI